jgi:DNA repair exonuclease SbcCD ATPase subunit
MDMVQSAGQWNVQFVVINPAGVELDPLDGCGGGIADIVSMTLRIAILQMYEPLIEGPALFDENGKFISRDHIRGFVEFLHTIQEKTNRQIIFVTHTPELASGADRVFEVTMEGETSNILDVTQEKIIGE